MAKRFSKLFDFVIRNSTIVIRVDEFQLKGKVKRINVKTNQRILLIDEHHRQLQCDGFLIQKQQ